jgi:predicted Zn-dependent protease
MLPKTFVSDFGASLGDYATFIDPNNNQFEVMVERIRDSVFLTSTWYGSCGSTGQ